jgi:hypothetical protein
VCESGGKWSSRSGASSPGNDVRRGRGEAIGQIGSVEQDSRALSQLLRGFGGTATGPRRLARFEDRYNAAARPFKWKFTTTDLADLLDRLDRHQQAQCDYLLSPATRLIIAAMMTTPNR